MSVIVGLIFIDQLVALAAALPGGDLIPRQIANAHAAFNLLRVAGFIAFTPGIARMLEWMIPDAGEVEDAEAVPNAG